jgi:glycosyl transferase family 2
VTPDLDLSVVLVNHNGADCLPRALRALAANTTASSVGYFVVDSASNDGSWRGNEEDWPRTHVLRYDENIGMAWRDGLRRMPAKRRTRSREERSRAAYRVVSPREAIKEQRRISRLWGQFGPA